MGYKVVRIPYFIQLANSAIKTLFGVEVKEVMFDGKYPSLGVNGNNTPAFLCLEGIKRMAKEFRQFPDQYQVNIDYLKSLNDEYLTGAKLLETQYNSAIESE